MTHVNCPPKIPVRFTSDGSGSDSHDTALRNECGAIRDVDHGVRSQRHAAGKRERSAGQERMRAGRVEWDSHDVSLRIAEIGIGEELRGVEVAVWSERASVDRPETGCPRCRDREYRR